MTSPTRQPNGAIANAPFAGDDPERQLPENAALSEYDRGWRKIVRNFTPSYVSSLMYQKSTVDLL